MVTSINNVTYTKPRMNKFSNHIQTFNISCIAQPLPMKFIWRVPLAIVSNVTRFMNNTGERLMQQLEVIVNVHDPLLPDALNVSCISIAGSGYYFVQKYYHIKGNYS